MNNCCKKWKETQGVKLRGQHTISPKRIIYCPECSERLKEVTIKYCECGNKGLMVVNGQIVEPLCCGLCYKPFKLTKSNTKWCKCEKPMIQEKFSHCMICWKSIKPKKIKKLKILPPLNGDTTESILLGYKINEIIDHINKEKYDG